jgi:ankyrin repeat protein
MWSVTDPKKVKLLLDNGAEVNKTARSGRTALIVAAFANPSADVVRMLLAKGADVSAMDQRKVTPLNAATFGNDTATIRLLVAAGADVNTTDTFVGLSPLMNAAGNRNLAAVKLLLAKGAKVNAVGKLENLPRVRTGTVEFGGFTPLLMAAPFGPPEIVKTLLEAGADVNVQDVRGFSPLMLAVGTDRQDSRIVRLLLAHGAGPAVKNRDGETALDWAYKIGEMETIAALGGGPRPLRRRAASPASTPSVRTALERSVALLDKSVAQFFAQSGCFACHEQPAAEFAAAAARARGIHVDEKAASARRQQMAASLVASGPSQMEGAPALGGADNNLYLVEALLRGGYPPDRATDYLAASIAALQGGDGGWHLPGYSRSPVQDSDFSRTALGIRALKTYGPPGRAAEIKDRIERAKRWLLNARPVILEDWDMRLIGVSAAGAGLADRKLLASPILALQRADGGWSQRQSFESDAYATGMTLWALAETGVVQPSDPVFQRGVRFLLSTQAADGSWHVSSRATKFQPYFESGFPYGHDQWISTMGTGWAANALALALDALPTPQKRSAR